MQVRFIPNHVVLCQVAIIIGNTPNTPISTQLNKGICAIDDVAEVSKSAKADF